jgi:hypothetical protein
MDCMIATGDAVTVVRSAENRTPLPAGRVVNVTDQAILLGFRSDVGLVPGERVVLLATRDGHRLVVSARYAGASGSNRLFLTPAGWHPVESREAHRFPLGHPAEVRSVLGQSRQQGAILDISAGGLAVLLPQKPGGRQVEVRLELEGYAATLLARAVATTPHDEGVVLHLQFLDLASAQHAFVRNLLLRLAPEANDPGQGAATA